MPTDYHPAIKTDMPADYQVYHPALAIRQVLQDFAMLFKKDLGCTTVTECVIVTGDALPVKVPPCLIPWPFHYSERSYKKWHMKVLSDRATALGVLLLFMCLEQW